MNLEIIVPALMACALLWWIGRGIGMMARLVTVAITLAIVAAIVLFERSTP